MLLIVLPFVSIFVIHPFNVQSEEVCVSNAEVKLHARYCWPESSSIYDIPLTMWKRVKFVIFVYRHAYLTYDLRSTIGWSLGSVSMFMYNPDVTLASLVLHMLMLVACISRIEGNYSPSALGTVSLAAEKVLATRPLTTNSSRGSGLSAHHHTTPRSACRPVHHVTNDREARVPRLVSHLWWLLAVSSQSNQKYCLG